MQERPPSTASWVISAYVGRVAAWVLVLALLIAALCAWRWSVTEAWSVLYAALLSVINMLILGSRLLALPAAPAAAGKRLGGAVLQRWVFTIVALLLAVAWLKLPVPGLVIGFLLAHFVYLGFMLRERSRKRR
ncbi:ATP synthase subunit I [Acidithiobacillus sp.]|uniref:ATP synthase subunit I n=1 Tax=Acidithiobacillus sp. TaxID=1872118 RepID=UPI0032AF90B6